MGNTQRVGQVVGNFSVGVVSPFYYQNQEITQASAREIKNFAITPDGALAPVTGAQVYDLGEPGNTHSIRLPTDSSLSESTAFPNTMSGFTANAYTAGKGAKFFGAIENHAGNFVFHDALFCTVDLSSNKTSGRIIDESAGAAVDTTIDALSAMYSQGRVWIGLDANGTYKTSQQSSVSGSYLNFVPSSPVDSESATIRAVSGNKVTLLAQGGTKTYIGTEKGLEMRSDIEDGTSVAADLTSVGADGGWVFSEVLDGMIFYVSSTRRGIVTIVPSENGEFVSKIVSEHASHLFDTNIIGMQALVYPWPMLVILTENRLLLAGVSGRTLRFSEIDMSSLDTEVIIDGGGPTPFEPRYLACGRNTGRVTVVYVAASATTGLLTYYAAEWFIRNPLFSEYLPYEMLGYRYSTTTVPLGALTETSGAPNWYTGTIAVLYQTIGGAWVKIDASCSGDGKVYYPAGTLLTASVDDGDWGAVTDESNYVTLHIGIPSPGTIRLHPPGNVMLGEARAKQIAIWTYGSAGMTIETGEVIDDFSRKSEDILEWRVEPHYSDNIGDGSVVIKSKPIEPLVVIGAAIIGAGKAAT